MNKMWAYLTTNAHWIFSGIGVFVLGVTITAFCAAWRYFSQNLLKDIEMNNMWTYLTTNAIWIFGAIGATILSAVIAALWTSRKHLPPSTITRPATTRTAPPTETLKTTTHILFIDDDTTFRVVNILQNAGWLNTRIVNDVPSISDNAVTWAHILFIDINGVGRETGFNDEGLGLALAVKKRYPSKKVVIYSADTKAERFHDAWKVVDEYLQKNSDAYQFEEIIEKFAKDIGQ
jgi:hypothetical protein